jgi:hypothetical protein
LSLSFIRCTVKEVVPGQKQGFFICYLEK